MGKGGRPGGAPQNLISLGDRSPEERKKIATKGGKASGESKRLAKSLREAAKNLGEEVIVNSNGDKATRNYVIIMQQYNRAMNGDIKAAKFLTQLLGELVEKHEIESKDFTIRIGGQPIEPTDNPE